MKPYTCNCTEIELCTYHETFCEHGIAYDRECPDCLLEDIEINLPEQGQEKEGRKMTIEAIEKLNPKTVAKLEAVLGAKEFEPLLVSMDAMLRYAKAHKAHYGSTLSDDGFLGPYYAQTISSLKELLNGQGGVAMERGMTGDSKDNGVIESLFWKCCEEAGFDGDKI